MIKTHFVSLPAKAKSLVRNKKFLLAVVIAIVLGSVLVSTVTLPAATTKTTPHHGDHQRELQGAVDNATGAPQNGRDPASQAQNSLAAAASRPDGPGQRTDNPAADVEGDHSHHAHPTDSPANVTSSGCIVGYGKPGEQCLPTPGKDKPVTCDHVRKYFPHGVQVTGNDSYHLDKNHDKTACGHGD